MKGFVLARLERHAVRVSAKTLWVFVRAIDADGLEGWGEGTLPGAGSDAALTAAIARLGSSLVGERIATPIDLTAHLAESGSSVALETAAAVSAVDQALWDIAGRRAGKPIAALLGQSSVDAIGLYANINRRTLDRSPAGFAASATTAHGLGYRAFKIAPFDGVTPANAESAEGRAGITAGLARAAAVRAAIGREARLMIDCHWRLTEATAGDVIARAAPLDLYWLECATPEVPENFPAMRRLRARAHDAGMRVAGCETMIGRAGFTPFFEAELYDVVMPDVKYAGGLAEFLRIAALAHAFGVLCSAHNPSGPICHAHSLQVSSLVQASPFLEHQFDESPLFKELVIEPPADFTAPRVARLRRAGLGITLDRAVLARHAEAVA